MNDPQDFICQKCGKKMEFEDMVHSIVYCNECYIAIEKAAWEVVKRTQEEKKDASPPQ
jgi:ribosomal protein L37AE/L43A